MNQTSSKRRLALLPLLAALVLAGCATSASIDPSSLPAAPPAFKENANTAVSSNASASAASTPAQGQGL